MAMKSAHDAPILVQPAMGLALEGDTPAEAFNVMACLTEIELLVKNNWEPKIRLDLQASPDMPVVTWCRKSLQSAIMNLLLNARDAMPDGGVISIVAAAHYQGRVATGIEFRVTDNGLGMTSNTLLHAIDPFFTTKATGLGGLGLPMVTCFAQEAGGRLHIESEPGVGTIVTLSLPLPESKVEGQPGPLRFPACP
jgi:signal transduction histidine kinase